MEPTPLSPANPLLRVLLATRPPFLGASLVPALIGLGAARHAGLTIDPWSAALSVIGILVIHAAVNVLNDYYDSRNGTDAINTERVFPFTGGSRYIQNGVMSEAAMGRLGAVLMAIGILIGLVLTWHSGPALLPVGIAGVLLGWTYSAPPAQLAARGLGELAVGAGFGLLIPLGMWLVQGGGADPLPLVAGMPYAFLVTNILYINQFPDRQADAATGKRHLVVRLGTRHARWLYSLLIGGALASLAVGVLYGPLPAAAAGAAVALVPAVHAARILLLHANEPQRLEPALKATIGTAMGFGLLLALLLAIFPQAS